MPDPRDIGSEAPHAANRAFAAFSAPLIGLPLTHLWRGEGSAIVMEFGWLAVGGRRNGAPGHARGEMSLMVEWGWRIEGRRSILCGSWSPERRRERGFALLRDSAVTRASLFGRLPEIEVVFASGTRLLSFMTAEGDPMWTLFDRREPEVRWMGVRRGAVETGIG